MKIPAPATTTTKSYKWILKAFKNTHLSNTAIWIQITEKTEVVAGDYSSLKSEDASYFVLDSAFPASGDNWAATDRPSLTAFRAEGRLTQPNSFWHRHRQCTHLEINNTYCSAGETENETRVTHVSHVSYQKVLRFDSSEGNKN